MNTLGTRVAPDRCGSYKLKAYGGLVLACLFLMVAGGTVAASQSSLDPATRGYTAGGVLGSTGWYRILTTGQLALYPSGPTMPQAGMVGMVGMPAMPMVPNVPGFFGMAEAGEPTEIHAGAHGWYWIAPNGALILYPLASQ